MSQSRIMTRHHICPKVRGGAISEHENIKMLEMNVHRRLHDFFGVKLPHEQLQQVIDIAKTALSPGLHRDLNDVLQSYQQQFYKPWVYDRKTHLITPEYGNQS